MLHLKLITAFAPSNKLPVTCRRHCDCDASEEKVPQENADHTSESATVRVANLAGTLAAEVTAVSNSRTQKEFIDSRCKERGLSNLTVVTADVTTYQTKETFDRVVSVEMFEHMKNYQVPLSGFSTYMG